MPIVLLWGFVGAGLAGLLLVVLGRRGRRVGDHPVCRRCNFDLRGRRDDDTVCPECARDLGAPRAVARGERRPSALATGGGVALLVACGVIVTAVLVGGPSVHRSKPLSVLLFEARFASTAHNAELGAEILRRNAASPFDAETRARVADALLDLQGDPALAWAPSFGDFLEQAGISPARNERYERQMVVLEARARERIAPGFPIPVLVEGVEVRAGSATDRDLYLAVHRPTVNGRAARFVRGEGRGEPDAPLGIINLRVMTAYPLGLPLGGVALIEPSETIETGRLAITIDAVVRPQGAQQAIEPPDDEPWWTTFEMSATLADAEATVASGKARTVDLSQQRSAPKIVSFPPSGGITMPPYLVINRISADDDFAHRVVIRYADGCEHPAGWYTTAWAPESLLPREGDLPPPPQPWGANQQVYKFLGTLGGHSGSLDRPIELEHGMRLILRPDPWFAEHTIDVFEVPGGEVDLGPITIDRRP